ncbi:helix-turn-helix transcriptional regulator [Variovorax sp. RT4R15]|uniref:helix-turn-helix transcriptional regulator n=1 Tax=Variovorax sp. RT4R15 TaxID=3443737 RepID=UPI003F4731FC
MTEFSHLLLRLYRMAQDLPISKFQDAALDLVKPVLPFDSSLWGTATGTADGVDIHTVHLHNKSPEMLVAYEPVKHQDTAVAPLFAQPKATRGFNHLETWFPAPGQREIRDVMRRFEIENMLATVVNDPRTKFAHWILLYRADRNAIYTAEEIARLEQLAPHVMEALAINRKVHLELLNPADAGAPPRGSAIADPRGVIYHADPDFEAMLQVEWDDWSGGTLPPTLLQHLLHGHECFRGGSVVVTHRIEQGLLFLKSRPRCRADGLTPREHTIAQLVSKGDTYKEIARILDRSPATVRNHIRAIYEKLAVSNIAGLIEELRLAD